MKREPSRINGSDGISRQPDGSPARFGRAARRTRIALAAAVAWCTLLAVRPLHAQCTNDIQLADDLSGQKDLSQFCIVGTCNVNDTTVSWNFDDTAWSGNNTGDACALFDTDG